MRPVLVFRREHCLACRGCELACSVAHSKSGELEAALAEEFPPKRRVVVAAGSMLYSAVSQPWPRRPGE